MIAVLQFVYNETAETNLGPFTVEAKLTSVGGAVLYATGQGRVSHRHRVFILRCRVLTVQGSPILLQCFSNSSLQHVFKGGTLHGLYCRGWIAMVPSGSTTDMIPGGCRGGVRRTPSR